jgi:hypothetical protein
MPRLLAAAVVCAALVLTPATASAKPKPPKPSKSPDGHYVGHEVPVESNGLNKIVFEFDVAKNGRKIIEPTVRLNLVCGYPLGIQYHVQPIDPMKVDPRTGKFHFLLEKDSPNDFEDYRVELSGRLKGTRVVQGTFSIEVGYCSRGDADDPMRWAASRTSKKTTKK